MASYFPNLPFAILALVEAPFVVLDIPCQAHFQAGFDLPHLIFSHSDGLLVLPSSPPIVFSLLPHSMNFFLPFEIH